MVLRRTSTPTSTSTRCGADGLACRLAVYVARRGTAKDSHRLLSPRRSLKLAMLRRRARPLSHCATAQCGALLRAVTRFQRNGVQADSAAVVTGDGHLPRKKINGRFLVPRAFAVSAHSSSREEGIVSAEAASLDTGRRLKNWEPRGAVSC